MKKYRFILEKKGSRHTCPGCGKRREFTRYIDTRTGELLPEQYGICNRLDRCGYHINPYKEGHSQRIWEQERGKRLDNWKFNPPIKVLESKPRPRVSFISNDVLRASLLHYGGNSFALFLTRLFGEEITGELIGRYFIGSSNHRFRNIDHPDYTSGTGATVFWQIDVSGEVRAGKIMLYDPEKGKRIKNPFNHVTWVHKVLRLPDYELRQCLYGEHLLREDKLSPVALVESEKTAIIASVYFPQFLWLACGALNSLNPEKCQILKGRHVILFPDLNAFEKWNTKAKELTQTIPGTLFTVSDLLEKNASETDKREGLDIADYLSWFDWRKFRDSEKGEKSEALNKFFIEQKQEREDTQAGEMIPETAKSTDNLKNLNPNKGQSKNSSAVQRLVEAKYFEPNEQRKHETIKTESWERAITELETYFAGIVLPSQPVKLNPYSTITNTPLFIESQLAVLKANNGKRMFLPYLNRLQELKERLTSNLH